MPRYPKPDDQKINRSKPAFTWQPLPAQGRSEPAPPLPTWKEWDDATLEWWEQMWRSPQAVMWKDDGSTMLAFALIMDDVHAGKVDITRASPEIRQHQDRHGLNPKSMLQLRWKIEESETVPEQVEEDDYRHLRMADSA